MDKVNCHVHQLAGGGYHLVFAVEGTEHVVGDIRVNADERYLKVISQLFSQWVTTRRGRLPDAIRGILNGAPH